MSYSLHPEVSKLWPTDQVSPATDIKHVSLDAGARSLGIVCGWMLCVKLTALNSCDHVARKPEIVTPGPSQKKLVLIASSYWCHIVYLCIYYTVQNLL